MITWETIIEKLGFDPRTHKRDEKEPFEDDSKQSPYSKLNQEEQEWLMKEWCGLVLE